MVHSQHMPSSTSPPTPRKYQHGQLALSLQGFETLHNSLDGDLGISSGAFEHVETLLAVQGFKDCVNTAAEVGRARVEDLDRVGGTSSLMR